MLLWKSAILVLLRDMVVLWFSCHHYSIILLSLLYRFIQRSLNSGSMKLQILLVECHSSAMVLSFGGKPFQKCYTFKIMPNIFFLFCFVCLEESTWETSKNGCNSSFRFWDNQNLAFEVFKCHDVIKCTV